MFGAIQSFFDPEGYAAKQRAKFGIAICLLVLYTLWKSIVEIQFLVMSETTTASTADARHVVYQDGDENRRERLDVGTAAGMQVEIDYLPGVGLARLHGSRNWTPIIILLVATVVALILLLPVIREAREYANGTNNRKRRR